MRRNLTHLAVVWTALFLASTATAQVARNSAGVPEGLSAADWTAIQAAHEKGLQTARPARRARSRKSGRPEETTATGSSAIAARATESIEQQAYLKASNTDAGDRFGYALAVSGDTVVVGAYREDSAAIGIDGDQGDNSARNSGAAYVFVRNGTGWSQQAYFKASNTDTGDEFGRSVAVFGDTIVIGAPREDSNTTVVNGEQGSNGAFDSGAAYVFVRDGTHWTQGAYLKASNGEALDLLGLRVGVWKDTVVVGAWGEDSSATGANGEQSDNSSPDSGAAYVFVRNGSSWSQEAYLKASNTGEGDEFGFPVVVANDTIVVGARKEDSPSRFVNGENGDGSTDSGAAYVFTRSGETWSQQAYLKASNSDAGDGFGHSVAVSGDTVLVGAYLEDSASTGVNGIQEDNSATDSGAAYVFERTQMGWIQAAYLKASNTDAFDRFSLRLDVKGDVVAVGAYQEKGGATGVNGFQASNNTDEAGAAYIFARSGTDWRQWAYVKASNTDVGDNFGRPIVISGNTVAIGAYPEDSSSTGVNGNQSNNSADTAGAAYIFILRPKLILAVEDVRVGLPPNPSALRAGQTRGPILGEIWDPIIDHTSFVPRSKLDFLAISLAPDNVWTRVFGTLLGTTPIFTYVALPKTAFAVRIPSDSTLIGSHFFTQGASWDGRRVALTNALDITLGLR